MEYKINENHSFNQNTYEILMEETSEASSKITELCLEISGTPEYKKLLSIEEQFNSIMHSWIDLSESLVKQIAKHKKHSKEIIIKNQRYRAISDEKILKQKRRLREKESSIKSKQRYINKSLTKIRKLWKGNLKDMECKILEHKTRKPELNEKIDNIKNQIINEIVKEPDLSFIERQKKLAITEGINITRNQASIEPSLIFSEHSEEQINESYAFEELMKEIDAQKGPSKRNQSNISIEKSFGGWKSEYDSENDSILPVNPAEIKKAIEVLKKANLLNPQNGGVLHKLTDLIKDPDNSERLELILQLINFHSKPSQDTVNSLDIKPVKEKKLSSPNLIECKDFIISTESPLSSQNSTKLLTHPEVLREHELNDNFQSEKLDHTHIEESIEIPFFDVDMRFATSESANKPPRLSEDNHGQQELLSLDNYSPTEIKASPVKKQTTLDYQSTGISSQTGFRSRITLKTVGSEFSQKVFTPSSKSIEEAFKDM
ncbi:hypothetical protein SteCoe_30021 [Stentor coeruleus]|uniref:Uncharacterized protein n=1 Tax=Stentor coeruleus TaxID=5963 RepID=A0A1R2B4H2_9CILI|nr:hypothetical protein SteCoe_30021 [Stentor coeruleus]